MSKAVMLSIRPKWCEKIASGEKTIEVRKTRPKLETPFKCYIYCTQSGVALVAWGKHGKVIGEFTCDRIDRLAPANEPYGIYDIDDDYVLQTCLENGALWDYGHGTPLFGWHIVDLKMYDAPKDLNEFWLPPELYCEKERCGGCPYDQVADVNGEYSFDCEWKRPLTRPPQSWCYVEEG